MAAMTESFPFMDICMVESVSILMDIIIQLIDHSVYFMKDFQQLAMLDSKYSLKSNLQ